MSTFTNDDSSFTIAMGYNRARISPHAFSLTVSVQGKLALVISITDVRMGKMTEWASIFVTIFISMVV